MNLNHVQSLGAGVGEGVIDFSLDPVLVWAVYLAILAVDCAALLLVQRFSKPPTPTLGPRRTPRPQLPSLDKAA